MKTLTFKAIVMMAAIFCLSSCDGGGTDVVESGTYTGTVDKVEPEKDEIYVETEDDKRLELYFTETTQLTRGGQPVAFEELEKGQNVQVTVEKVGQRLDPISVEIME